MLLLAFLACSQSGSSSVFSPPSKTITAKWTYQDGQTVNEGSETIAPTGPASTEFHLAKKSPWPVGKYKVEISVDGSPAGAKDLEIKK